MTQAAASRTDERTTYEAVMDVKYGCVFNRLNQRLYERLDGVLGFVGLAGGSSAIAAGFAGNATAMAWVGGVVAALAIVERLVGAARKAEIHRQAQEAYAELQARCAGMALDAIDRELVALQARFPDGVAGLAEVAFNRNVASNGRAECQLAVPGWGRLLSRLV